MIAFMKTFVKILAFILTISALYFLTKSFLFFSEQTRAKGASNTCREFREGCSCKSGTKLKVCKIKGTDKSGCMCVTPIPKKKK